MNKYLEKIAADSSGSVKNDAATGAVIGGAYGAAYGHLQNKTKLMSVARKPGGQRMADMMAQSYKGQLRRNILSKAGKGAAMIGGLTGALSALGNSNKK